MSKPERRAETTAANAPATRRDFLRAGAALGAGLGLGPATAFSIVPARALGRDADDPVPASERVRVGMIGVGNQGLGNLRKVLRSVVAVCDVDSRHLGRAKSLVEIANGPGCKTFADFRAMLDDPDVDAVLISTPDHWHALPTVLACMAGKDVYVEKPLSLTVAEGRAMVAAARRYDRVVQTGSQQRSDAKFRRACELVRNGALGKIREIVVGLPGVNFDKPPAPDSEPPAELDYDFWLGPAPARPYNPRRVHYDFRFWWDYSGGQLTNWGAHHLDIVQWALGMDHAGPVEVEAHADHHPDGWYEVPKSSVATYTYPGDVKVVCRQGGDAPNGVRFLGERGELFVSRGKLEANPAAILEDAPAPTAGSGGGDFRLEVSDDHHANWLSCVKTRERPVCDVEIGHRSATVCHLANLAIRTAANPHSGEGYRDVGHLTWDSARERVVAFVGKSDPNDLLDRPARAPWSLPDIS